MSLFLASLGFGLVTASVLAIAAVGFTLQFGVTDVLNLAYGAVMIAGAFIAYLLNNAGVSVWAGLVVAVVVCSLGSVVLNALVYTPFQRRGATPITMVIVSLGITLIIEFGIQALAGGTNVSYHLAPGPDAAGRRADPDRRAARDHRAQPGGDGRRARAAALHPARQGHAGHRGQPRCWPATAGSGPAGSSRSPGP